MKNQVALRKGGEGGGGEKYGLKRNLGSIDQ